MIYHPDGHPLTDVVEYDDTRPYMILDQTLMQWFRRPRSKKRRIRRKWRKNPANWRPSPFIFQEHLILGSAAGRHIPQAELNRPRYMMHPVTWRAALAKDPTIAARFDVLEQGTWRAQPAAPILKSRTLIICQIEDIMPFLTPLAKFGPIVASAAANYAKHLELHMYDIFPPPKPTVGGRVITIPKGRFIVRPNTVRAKI